MDTPDTNGEAPGPTGPDSDEVRTAAAAAVTPDAVTADLLAKHSAGVKLTQPEYGKIGAFASNLKRWAFGPARTDGASTGPALPAPRPGNAAAVAALESPEASGGGLAAVPIDAGLVQRTTGAVLTRCESIARRYVGTAARDAGATGETLARFERAATLSKDDRSLMIELSPDVFTSLGINPRNFPVAVFFGTFGLWATDLWLAVQDLKAMKEKRPESTSSVTTTATVLPMPGTPPNAPPAVMGAKT